MSSPAAAGQKRRHSKGADGDALGGAASAAVVLDSATEHMTVEQYLKHQLSVMEEKAREAADDAIDALTGTFKQQREELRDDMQARKQAEAAPKSKPVRDIAVDVELTVEEACPEQASLVGSVLRLAPRQCPGGMCKVGRATQADFVPPRGASFSADSSVSTWHGKFASLWGSIWYTDLSKNGTRLNGELIPRDSPALLRSGDRLTVGGEVLLVRIAPAAPETAAAASAGPLRAVADSASGAAGAGAGPSAGGAAAGAPAASGGKRGARGAK